MQTKETERSKGYLGLCYHYVRPAGDDPFPRILGLSHDEFVRHVRMLKENYQVISLEEARDFSCGQAVFADGRYGVLMSFDDGLSDHYLAARLMAEQDVKGLFFLPTCILQDRLPANPTIIHYCLADFGIEQFLAAYVCALEDNGLDRAEHAISFEKGLDDPWDVIARIKSVFKYELKKDPARAVLLHIYQNLLLKRHPQALEMMHLTEEQIRAMLDMGHAIGVHSRTHISVAASELTPEEFEEEIVAPRRYLEKKFGVEVRALSYPFGEEKDCLSAGHLLSQSGEYQLAFTIEKIVNTNKTSPLELGRYMPHSRDDAGRLREILQTIIERQGDELEARCLDQ